MQSNNPELVFNAWFIIDIATNLSKYVILKPYCLEGNDEEKVNVLKTLAETDYTTSERIDFAQNCSVEIGNKSLAGYTHKSLINSYFEMNIDFFLNEMEKNLPKRIQFRGDVLGESNVIEQKFPDTPLFVQTFLMENEYGEMKPYTTPENKAWYESEKRRIDEKSKGFQN